MFPISCLFSSLLSFIFLNDTATPEIYTLSLHDALPISVADGRGPDHPSRHRVLREGVSTAQVAVTAVGVAAIVWVLWYLDRKSTRLNSSHLGISYAVFCLKKKRKYVDARE